MARFSTGLPVTLVPAIDFDVLFEAMTADSDIVWSRDPDTEYFFTTDCADDPSYLDKIPNIYLQMGD